MPSIPTDREYLKQLTLLYIEDDETTSELFTQFLQRLVAQVIVARNGAEGLQAFQQHRPHLVVTDIQMPEMDGLSMAQEIRAVDRTVPIIVLTAFEQVDYLKQSINIAVTRYITKPVDGVTLQQVLLECATRLREEEQLRAAARTDLLTGLPNRRELEVRFQVEKGRAERYGAPFALIMADIDLFKQINDRYGHLAGDRVIRAVADTLSGRLRAEDCCGRWGGEEFLLLLTSSSIATAFVVAEQLRSAVAETTVDWERQLLRVTVSMGVTVYLPGCNLDLDRLVKQADQAMYLAKQAGRNRVVAAEAD